MIRDIINLLPEIEWIFDYPYYNFTTLGAGKTAPVVAKIASICELKKLIKLLNQRQIPFEIISGGSNILGMDKPYQGVIILPVTGEFRECKLIDDNIIVAGCATRLIEVANFALTHNLGGFHQLVGIPGGVGGSIIMNAGVRDDEISNYICRVFAINQEGEEIVWEHDQINWQYRTSNIDKNFIITHAHIKLCKIDDATLEKELISQELKNRRSREPKGRSAGCMFKNVSAENSAGKLIDLVGLRGFKIGGAMISNEHANYIINHNHATENDVVQLMKLARAKVAEKYNFNLTPEVYFLDKESKESVMNNQDKIKVLVLKGGVSSEREVSLRSGDAIFTALKNANFDVSTLDITECKIYPEMLNCDVVYIGLHGGFGENGEIQQLLADNSIKFVGSNAEASRLVMDKVLSKELANSIGIPTAKWATVYRDNPKFPEALKFPVVLKVPNEGSTVGIEVAKDLAEYDIAIKKELDLADEILVEEFIEGVEITVPIIIDKSLTAIEIHSPHGFYDYDAKYVYNNGKTEYFCPVKNASIDSVNLAAKYSLEFFNAANCKDILRVDFIIDKSGTPYFLEANNLPGSTATSLVPKAAKYDGISFEELVSSLVLNQL